MGSISKYSIQKWIRHFRSGTIVNELHTNRKAARRFFGTSAVLRGNILELFMICFAHQIQNFRDDELMSRVEMIRSGGTLNSRQSDDSHRSRRRGDMSKSDFRRVGQTGLSGSLNLWAVACPGVLNPQYPSADCVKDLKSWAVALLKTLK